VTADQAVTVVVTVAGTQLASTPTFTYKYYSAQITSVTATSLNTMGKALSLVYQ